MQSPQTREQSTTSSPRYPAGNLVWTVLLSLALSSLGEQNLTAWFRTLSAFSFLRCVILSRQRFSAYQTQRGRGRHQQSWPLLLSSAKVSPRFWGQTTKGRAALTHLQTGVSAPWSSPPWSMLRSIWQRRRQVSALLAFLLSRISQLVPFLLDTGSSRCGDRRYDVWPLARLP